MLVSAVMVAPVASSGILINDNIATAWTASSGETIIDSFGGPPATVHRVYAIDLLAGDTLAVGGGMAAGDPLASSVAVIFDSTATDVLVDEPLAMAEEGTTTVQCIAPEAGTYYIDIVSSWGTNVAYGWMITVVPGEGGPGDIQPEVTFEPDLVSFQCAPGEVPPASQTVTITIGGFESPAVSWYLYDIPEWLTIEPSGGTAPGTTVMEISVDTRGLQPGGSYEADIQVAVEIPSFPTGFSGASMVPDSYGTLPVAVDFRYESEIASFAVSPKYPKRTSTTTPKTLVSGRLVTSAEVNTETALAGQEIEILASSDNVTFSTVATVATDADGAFSYQPSVARKTYLKAAFEGNDVLGSSASSAELCIPYAYLLRPTAPDSAYRSRSFATYGYLYPKHTATYPVTLRFYRYERLSSGKYGYVYRKSVSAKRIDSSSSRIRYKGVTYLKYAGKWRVRAVHSDSDHKTSYSAYDYFYVR